MLKRVAELSLSLFLSLLLWNWTLLCIVRDVIPPRLFENGTCSLSLVASDRAGTAGAARTVVPPTKHSARPVTTSNFQRLLMLFRSVTSCERERRKKRRKSRLIKAVIIPAGRPNIIRSAFRQSGKIIKKKGERESKGFSGRFDISAAHIMSGYI